MTIKEIEQMAEMDRANVRFYEKEGLIVPRRLENGYRDYSQEDLEILLRVKLLRSLDVPLNEIKSLKRGQKTLTDVIEAQYRVLESEKKAVSHSQEICAAIKKEQVTFEGLDAQKYLNGFAGAQESKVSLKIMEHDVVLQVCHPWRRFFARGLDLMIWQTIWELLLGLLFHVNLRNMMENAAAEMANQYAAIAIMLFVEPLLLHFFGTTPGKAVWGLRVESSDGRRLTYREGFERTWGVLRKGMGFALPVYHLIRLWKSYQLCTAKETQPWDDSESISISYTIKDTKWYRTVGFVGANILLVGVLDFALILQLLPPNRGNLSVEEFVENYEYYEKYLGIASGAYEFGQDGQWREKSVSSNGTFYLGLSEEIVPEYGYTYAGDGSISGITITEEAENVQDWLFSSNPRLLAAALAYAGAQEEIHVFTVRSDWDYISQMIGDSGFSSYEFARDGIQFGCQVEYEGFEEGYYDGEGNEIMVPKEGQENQFRRVFTMEKNP